MSSDVVRLDMLLIVMIAAMAKLRCMLLEIGDAEGRRAESGERSGVRRGNITRNLEGRKKVLQRSAARCINYYLLPT